MSTAQGSAASQDSGPVARRTRALPPAMSLSRFRLSRELVQKTVRCAPEISRRHSKCVVSGNGARLSKKDKNNPSRRIGARCEVGWLPHTRALVARRIELYSARNWHHILRLQISGGWSSNGALRVAQLPSRRFPGSLYV